MDAVPVVGPPRARAFSVRSAALETLQKLHEVKAALQRAPDITFMVTKINVRGRRQNRAICVTSTHVLNLRPKFTFRRKRTASTSSDETAGIPSNGVIHDASAAVSPGTSLDNVSSLSPVTRTTNAGEKTAANEFYCSKRLKLLDMLSVSMDTETVVRLKMRRGHDYVYETTLASVIHREILRRIALNDNLADLEATSLDMKSDIQRQRTMAGLIAPISGEATILQSYGNIIENESDPKSTTAAVPATLKSKRFFGSEECLMVINVVHATLYDPATAEGRTRARFLSTDFPRALHDTLQLLRAQAAATYAANTLVPEISQANVEASRRESSFSIRSRSPSTWFAWIARKTFSEREEDPLAEISQQFAVDVVRSPSAGGLPSIAEGEVEWADAAPVACSRPAAASVPTSWNSTAALGELRSVMKNKLPRSATGPIRRTVSGREIVLSPAEVSFGDDASDSSSSEEDTGLHPTTRSPPKTRVDSCEDGYKPELAGLIAKISNSSQPSTQKITAMIVIREVIDLIVAYILDRRKDQLAASQGSMPWFEEGAEAPADSMESPRYENEADRIAHALSRAVEMLTEGMSVHPTVVRLVSREVECSLFNVLTLRHGIANVVNYVVDSDYSAQVHAKTLLLREVDQSFVGIPLAMQQSDNWEGAVKQLRRAESAAAPTEKLYAIQLYAKSIYEVYARHEAMRLLEHNTSAAVPVWDIPPLGADEFFPIFVFVVIRAKLLAPLHLKELLWLAADPAELRGQSGYWLTVFEAALEYIRVVPLPLDAPKTIASG
jgi:hypothetical protein